VEVAILPPSSNSTNCSLLSVVGPGTYDPDYDTYVRVWENVDFDFTSTYNVGCLPMSFVDLAPTCPSVRPTTLHLA
jgi:hypothetical protein